MSDVTHAAALIHGTFSTVDSLWDDQIESGQVSQSGGTTTITYSLLQQLPSYYNGEPESIVSAGQPAFHSISNTSPLGQALDIILGVSAADRV